MSDVVEQDRQQQPLQQTRQWPKPALDPQEIQEDPDVGKDPIIIKLRQAFGSGKNGNHLLKGREH